MDGMIELRLLGPVEVTYEGQATRGFKSKKDAVLLAYLLANNDVASRSFLADFLWGDKPESRGRANLSRVLHDVSSLLPDCIHADRNTIQLVHQDTLWVDVVRISELIRDSTVASLLSALQLYRGEFMMGISLDETIEVETWLNVERDRWRQRVSTVLQKLVSHFEAQGDYERSLSFARQLEQLEPWREEIQRTIMTLLARNGERSAALMQYETCRRVLNEELHIEPAKETVHLYEQIRAGRFHSTSSPVSLPDDGRLLPFFGREHEHAWLIDQWNHARHGSGKFTLIEGPAGSGKTRLMEEIVRYIQTSSAAVLRGRCYSFRQPAAFQPVASALREGLANAPDEFLTRLQTSVSQTLLAALAQLLPELHIRESKLPPVRSALDEIGRLHLFESITQFLQVTADANDGVILFIDDMQWADDATIDLLTYLHDRLSTAPVWFVGAYRAEGLDSAHPVLAMRHTFASEKQIAMLRLTPLSSEAIMAPLEALPHVDSRQARELAEFLYQQSIGNALVLTHYFEYLYGTGMLETIVAEPEHSLDHLKAVEIPFTVREALLGQVAHLSADARELLTLVAGIGVVFDRSVLNSLANPTVDVQAVVKEWFQYRLVKVESDQRYVFAHGLLRRVLYESIPDGRLQELHQEWAT